MVSFVEAHVPRSSPPQRLSPTPRLFKSILKRGLQISLLAAALTFPCSASSATPDRFELTGRSDDQEDVIASRPDAEEDDNNRPQYDAAEDDSVDSKSAAEESSFDSDNDNAGAVVEESDDPGARTRPDEFEASPAFPSRQQRGAEDDVASLPKHSAGNDEMLDSADDAVPAADADARRFQGRPPRSSLMDSTERVRHSKVRAGRHVRRERAWAAQARSRNPDYNYEQTQKEASNMKQIVEKVGPQIERNAEMADSTVEHSRQYTAALNHLHKSMQHYELGVQHFKKRLQDVNLERTNSIRGEVRRAHVGDSRDSRVED